MLPYCWVNKPTYSLETIKGLMKDGSWYLTESARDTATELGFDDEDVYDCVVNCLEETHFYKTMAATAKSGVNARRVLHRICWPTSLRQIASQCRGCGRFL